jgi:hypothetical protein
MLNASPDDVVSKRKVLGSLFFLPVLLATFMFILINTASEHFLQVGIWVSKTVILPAVLVLLAGFFHFFRK